MRESGLKENWFKVSALITLSIVTFSAIYYFVIFLPVQQQNISLQKQLAEQQQANVLLRQQSQQDSDKTQQQLNILQQKTNQSNLYNLQSQCSATAQSFFDGKKFNDPSNRSIATYTNHYNKSLSICFIRVKSLIAGIPGTPIGSFFILNLFDANEGTTYAHYSLDSDNKIQCNVLDKQCQTQDEFDLLTAPFMSN